MGVTADLRIVGARGAKRRAEDRLAAVKTVAGSLDQELQLLDARLVVGRDHLVSAAEHAARALRERRNVAKSFALEFVVYASGERQIADALRKMGIRDDTTEFALVLFGGANPEEALNSLDLDRDDRVLEPSEEKLRAYGLTDAEIGSVPPDRVADLVLERVAMVDLLK